MPTYQQVRVLAPDCRDPNDINDHVKVSFEDVLAEPEGAHSFDCVWTISSAMFNCWKLFCYRLHTLCYGICLAAEWGYLAAMTAFYHIWIVTPLFKLLEINCACVKMFYGMFVHCCLDPMFEACGNLFFVFRKS